MTPIVAVGFELWTVTEDVYFDNIIITSELTVANNFAYERSVQQSISIKPLSTKDEFSRHINQH